MSRIARIICAMPAKRCQTPISRRKRNEPSNNATVRPFGAVSDLPAQSTVKPAPASATVAASPAAPAPDTMMS